MLQLLEQSGFDHDKSQARSSSSEGPYQPAFRLHHGFDHMATQPTVVPVSPANKFWLNRRLKAKPYRPEAPIAKAQSATKD